MKKQEERDYIIITGVFDLISRKIREKIIQARDTGKLVGVGVYADEYVINNLSTVPLKNTEERMEIASGLNGVSFVFPTNSGKLDINVLIADEYYKKYLTNIVNKPETKQYKAGIVMGSFDLYHAGHHQNLELSNEICEHLYVLLKSDARILQKKGVMPQQSEADRTKVLETLKFVDAVIPYDIDSTRALAVQDVIKKHQELYGETLKPSDIVAIFGEDLWKKETEKHRKGEWCGINISCTPRDEYKMKAEGAGISSSCYRTKIHDEATRKGTTIEQIYENHSNIEEESLETNL
ncbi:MAG: adenylyltransferase/cytidyltransferase family protein [Clostridia bacterium]|nr:adenylyltransferase/cytidyltransferase family protein [Clostridia bacterium]